MLKALMLASIATLAATPTLSQPINTEQQILGSTIGNLSMENARLIVELQKAQAQAKTLQELLNAKQESRPSPPNGRGVPLPPIRQESGSSSERGP